MLQIRLWYCSNTQATGSIDPVERNRSNRNSTCCLMKFSLSAYYCKTYLLCSLIFAFLHKTNNVVYYSYICTFVHNNDVSVMYKSRRRRLTGPLHGAAETGSIPIRSLLPLHRRAFQIITAFSFAVYLSPIIYVFRACDKLNYCEIN